MIAARAGHGSSNANEMPSGGLQPLTEAKRHASSNCEKRYFVAAVTIDCLVVNGHHPATLAGT